MSAHVSFSFYLQIYITSKLFKTDSIITVFGCCMFVVCDRFLFLLYLAMELNRSQCVTLTCYNAVN